MNVILRILLVLFLLAAPVERVQAEAVQESGTLKISVPDMRSFPSIGFQMDAYDAGGSFLEDFTAENIEIVENGKAIRPSSVKTIQNGLQVIIALNTSPSMATVKEGISAYQAVQNGLVNWARSQPASTPDDFSLSTPTGLFLIREREPAQLEKAITEYQPDLLKTQPTLTGLAEALDLATDPLDRPFMKRALLFITPPMPPSADTTINDLTERARGIGVRVNVWVIAQPGNDTALSSPAMKGLAEGSGGQYAEVAPHSPLPDLKPLFEPLRHSYQITYTSQIMKSGEHTLSVQVSKSMTSLESNVQRFQLDVQPPNPILLSPPATIERVFAKAAADPANTLTPEDVALQIMIEFPDQRERALKATRLYVNGVLADENTSAPYDRFQWSLANVTTTGKQMLRVEAMDTLGLTGTSIEFPVEVLVEQPAAASLPKNFSSSGLIALAAIAAAGSALAFVLFLSSNKRRSRRSRQLNEKRLQKDPLTQPVKIAQEPPSKPRKDASQPPRSHSWPVAGWLHGAAGAPARLVALDENEQVITGGTLQLSRQEITFGTDPQRATQVLESPTVDGLHARLYRSEDGHYFLADQNSVAGTWINYAPITTSGARLEHGDLIHIGKVMFRFELTETEQTPSPQVQVIDLER